VCVIGAGPSGLAICKVLREARVPFTCFEAGPKVGGIWDVETGRGGGYRSLRTNTSISKMAFSDFPFPDNTPPFPHHSEMLAYFNAYADHFGIRDAIHLATPVERAEPLDSGGWRIHLAAGQTRDFSACIVATGQYGARQFPEPRPPGVFAGEEFHAMDYLDPETPIDCRDKRVVVVGLGSSAAEIASELAGGHKGPTIASRVTLSARSGRYIMPKFVGDQPLDANAPHPAAPIPKSLRWIPESARTRLMQTFISKVLGRIVGEIGEPAKWNLPNPSFPAYAERPTISDGFIPALESGRIVGKPGIERFEGKTIRYHDGTTHEADLIVWATGYRADFPFLAPEVLGHDASDLALYRRIAHPMLPNLYFIGFTRVLCSLWPLSEQQALWLAGVLSGRIPLPDAETRMASAIEMRRALPVFCNLHVMELRGDTH